jgi:TetR/AcrR family transcriptional repressor of nem operon
MGRTSDAKERLMDAALALIWEESYGAVTIDDICTRADVRKGSFYHFFESKSDLAVAAVDRLWREKWQPELDRAFSPTVGPLERVRGYLAGIHAKQAETALRHGKVLGCPICSVGSEVSTGDPVLSGKLREIFSHKIRYYESAIREALSAGLVEACDPHQRAMSLMGLIEGLVAQARIMNDAEVLRSLPQMGLDLLRPKAAAAA